MQSLGKLNGFRLLTTLALAATVTLAFGQTGEGEKRGSIPIGTSQDGSGPSDGVLKGGSIKRDPGTSQTPQRDVNRCKELSGVLQEECLLDLGPSAAGAALPDAAPVAAPNTLYADPRRRRR
jgi:hypothetical protein